MAETDNDSTLGFLKTGLGATHTENYGAGYDEFGNRVDAFGAREKILGTNLHNPYFQKSWAPYKSDSNTSQSIYVGYSQHGMGIVKFLLFTLLTSVLCFGVSFFFRLVIAMVVQTKINDITSYRWVASDYFSWVAAIVAGGFSGVLAANRGKYWTFGYVGTFLCVVVGTFIGFFAGFLGVVEAIVTYYNY
jgi:hypothetical protein